MPALNTGALAELQSLMQAHVLDHAGARDRLLPRLRSPAQATRAERGLDVYRFAYRARLREVLGSTFERTWAYLGDDEFDELCGRYIMAQPSTHPNLRDYGRSLPDHLRRELPADPEVAELSIMDWNLHVAFDAPDAPQLAAERLAALSETDWTELAFDFHPAVSLAVFEWNVLDVWHALDQEQEPPPAHRLERPRGHLFWRKDLCGQFRSVDDNEFAALQSLLAGEGFARVCAAIAADHPQAAEQTGHWLGRWIADGLLSGLREPEGSPCPFEIIVRAS